VTAEQELLDAERRAALGAAFAHLPPHSHQLLALLTADPPMLYAQISTTLGIPVGSTGPLPAQLRASRCFQSYCCTVSTRHASEECGQQQPHLRR
jgi:hypothetical protein